MKNLSLRVTLFAAALALGPLVLPAGLPAGPAPARGQQVSPDVRAEFARRVRERATAFAELQKLDRQAADRLRDGRDATEIHARQQNTQDRLDLIQLRLEVLATRYGLPLQPVQAPEAADGRDAVTKATDRVFSRGEARAREQLQRDMEEFLASVDFSDFLAE